MITDTDIPITAEQLRPGDVVTSSLLNADSRTLRGRYTVVSPPERGRDSSTEAWFTDGTHEVFQWFAEGTQVHIEPRREQP